MQTTSEWMNRKDIREGRAMTVQQLYAGWFNRDPNRPVHYNPFAMLSPADGFIIYSKVVDPDKEILHIKGGKYTVNTLLRKELNMPCLVIGIFMTLYDVHINRMPTSGHLDYYSLEALKAENLTMTKVETEILTNLGADNSNMKYNIYNERKVNRVYDSRLEQPYYMLQVADFEVDVIAHYYKRNAFTQQGRRFAIVKNGSQVDLIVPFVNPKLNFVSLVDNKIGMHVEAVLDKLVSIEGM